MANTLKDAVRLAGQNPESPNSIKLKEAILAGKMDAIAQQEGLDLAAFKQHFQSAPAVKDPREVAQTQMQAGGTPNASTLIQTATALGTAGANTQQAQDEQIKAKLKEGISPVSNAIKPALDATQEFLAPSNEQLAKHNAELTQRMRDAGVDEGTIKNIVDAQGGVLDPAIAYGKSFANTAANIGIVGKQVLQDPIQEYLTGAISGKDAADKLHQENQSLYEAVRNKLAPTDSQKSAYNSANMMQWFIPFIQTEKGAGLLANMISDGLQSYAIGVGQTGDVKSPEAIGMGILSSIMPLGGAALKKGYGMIKGEVKAIPEVKGLFESTSSPAMKIQTGSRTTGIFNDTKGLSNPTITAGEATKAIESQPQFLSGGKPNPLYVAPVKVSTPSELKAAADVAAPISKPDVMQITTKAEALGNNIDEVISKNFKDGLAQIPLKYGDQAFPQVVNDSKSAIEKIFQKEKIKIVKGKLDFSKSVFKNDSSLINTFWKDLKNNATPTAEDLRNLGQVLGDTRSAAWKAGSQDAVVGQMYDAFRESLGTYIPEIKALNTAYGEGRDVLKNASKYLKLNSEGQYLNIDKPGKMVAQQNIKAAEEYAKKLGIKHEGSLVDEAKSISEATRKSKIANTVAKEQIKISESEAQAIRKAAVNASKDTIVKAAKQVNMTTEMFNELLTKVAKGEPAAIKEFANKVWKYKVAIGAITGAASATASAGALIGLLLKK